MTYHFFKFQTNTKPTKKKEYTSQTQATRSAPLLELTLLVLTLVLLSLIVLRVSTDRLDSTQPNLPTNHLPSSNSPSISSGHSSSILSTISSAWTESLVRQLGQLVEATRPKPYTEREVEICAKLLYGEARGCTVEEQKLVIWCICNRADKYGQTIERVATAPQQFLGYSSCNPVLEELCSVVREVLDAWARGEEALVYPPYATSSEYLFFYGDGVHNWFREKY